MSTLTYLPTKSLQSMHKANPKTSRTDSAQDFLASSQARTAASTTVVDITITISIVVGATVVIDRTPHGQGRIGSGLRLGPLPLAPERLLVAE